MPVRLLATSICLGFLFACGGDDAPEPGGGGSDTGAATAAAPPAESKEDLRRRLRTLRQELTRKKQAVAARKKEADRAEAKLDALLEKHQQERREWTRVIMMQDQLRTARRGANRLRNEVGRLEARIAELKAAGAAGGREEMQRLREARD
ncbi:MAG: hypothetical protein ACE5JG_09665, partial [Planctomycetota bacterium]